MDAAKRKRLKPRLERRNAMKNIDYQVPASLASSFDDSSSPDFQSPSSLDLSPSLQRQTSIRVQGIDGEFELIFRSLGLSGPDDFAIPVDAWKAQRSRYNLSAKLPDKKVEDEKSVKLESRVSINRGIEVPLDEGQLGKSDVPSDSKPLGGGGIKGARPPVLSTPPVMLPPVVDDGISTWDLVRSLSDGVVDNDSPIRDEGIISSGEEDEMRVGANEVGDRGIDGGEESHSRRHGERNLISDSSSSTSRDDEESDGVVHKVFGGADESVYNVSPNGSFRRIFKSWQKGEILGKGSFGTVYEGFTDDGFFFAVKEVSLLDQGTQGKQSIFQLQQEIYLLSQFEHENIVRYLGTDRNKNTLYIFLELVTKGSLAKLYQKYRLRDSQVSSYTRQILSGLKYLHDRNVVHRDIKCANILVDANGSVKLADFGLAKATTMNDVKSSKGSPYWMAPEVVNLKSRGYGLAADIWGLGCTVLEMLTRQPPYSHLEGINLPKGQIKNLCV
ncbi:mitogen-activated protein kinase kinase kinase 1-like isoform X2 [Prosopis cineraria]|uniref:mitogen-activated protein kinase kinase kinase 1-like isoform X2 n=1 Tax=Prosopis cineraria TaxID=364024 RepID=UPI00240F2EE5|nr:mitogen-activated protein kinase kinase kinase 1-like isoform X2 [Prosopis cineraria]XP_054793373.1 mitogen-activated protein kinase kinase kinase 1-like isoform X2 [Prosopis cineraria]